MGVGVSSRNLREVRSLRATSDGKPPLPAPPPPLLSPTHHHRSSRSQPDQRSWSRRRYRLCKVWTKIWDLSWLISYNPISVNPSWFVIPLSFYNGIKSHLGFRFFRVKGVGTPWADAQALDLSPAEIRRRGMDSVQVKMRCKRNPNPNPKDTGVIPRRHAESATSASGKRPYGCRRSSAPWPLGPA
jgi:hypothetical protein